MPINSQFTLAPGGVAVIGGTGMRLQFVRVTGDSRCPADAVCIQGGDAIVEVQVMDGGTSRGYDLHTGDAARATVAHRDVRITLADLQPYPFSGRTTLPADYRATFEVTR